MPCCPETYWCTPSGPSTGTLDEETGIRFPPDDAIAGPFATAEEAVCSVCTECPFSVVPSVTISFENCTGTIPEGSVEMPLYAGEEETGYSCYAGAWCIYWTDQECAGGMSGDVLCRLIFWSSSGENVTLDGQDGTTENWSLDGTQCATAPARLWRWIDINSDYTNGFNGAVGGPSVGGDEIYRTTCFPCGTANFWTERQYLGRAQLYNGFPETPPPYTILGEADVFINP